MMLLSCLGNQHGISPVRQREYAFGPLFICLDIALVCIGRVGLVMNHL